MLWLLCFHGSQPIKLDEAVLDIWALFIGSSILLVWEGTVKGSALNGQMEARAPSQKDYSGNKVSCTSPPLFYGKQIFEKYLPTTLQVYLETTLLG